MDHSYGSYHDIEFFCTQCHKTRHGLFCIRSVYPALPPWRLEDIPKRVECRDCSEQYQRNLDPKYRSQKKAQFKRATKAWKSGKLPPFART